MSAVLRPIAENLERVRASLAAACEQAAQARRSAAATAGVAEFDAVLQPVRQATITAQVGGNVLALRQTNIVRMLAYSGIAQAGFMLAPFVVIEQNRQAALSAIVTYLVIYAAMNLGAFAVIIAVARKTRSAEISSMVSGHEARTSPPLPRALW